MATKAITKKEKIAAILLLLSGVSLILLYFVSILGVISPIVASPSLLQEKSTLTFLFYFLSLILYAFFM